MLLRTVAFAFVPVVPLSSGLRPLGSSMSALITFTLAIFRCIFLELGISLGLFLLLVMVHSCGSPSDIVGIGLNSVIREEFPFL